MTKSPAEVDGEGKRADGNEEVGEGEDGKCAGGEGEEQGRGKD